MARPDGEELAAELERLQVRIEEIKRELANPDDKPERPTAAERAAKRWGLCLAGIAVTALWAVSRPRTLAMTALGTATAATGVTSGVLLLPDPQMRPHGQDRPSVVETTTRHSTPRTTQHSVPPEELATAARSTTIHSEGTTEPTPPDTRRPPTTTTQSASPTREASATPSESSSQSRQERAGERTPQCESRRLPTQANAARSAPSPRCSTTSGVGSAAP